MTSYHNHTRFSDGSAEIADMVKAAARAGLSEVGISDHLVIHPAGRTFKWAMPLKRLGEYVAAVRRAAQAARLPVRLGIEADFFAATVARTRRLLDRHPFDFVIGSVHFAGGFLVDKSRKSWAELTPARREAKWRTYWRSVSALARSRAFDIVGHLDVPKRFGFRMQEEAPRAALLALDAIAESGMALELNTAGWRHPAREAYPSPALLRAARERGIPILISADAHSPADIARSFGPARRLAREAGYARTVRFADRKRSFSPL